MAANPDHSYPRNEIPSGLFSAWPLHRGSAGLLPEEHSHPSEPGSNLLIILTNMRAIGVANSAPMEYNHLW